MTEEEKTKYLDKLALAIHRVFEDPKRLMWRGFIVGLASGVGTVIGAAVLIVILSFLASRLGWIPWFGDFIESVYRAVPSQ